MFQKMIKLFIFYFSKVKLKANHSIVYSFNFSKEPDF